MILFFVYSTQLYLNFARIFCFLFILHKCRHDIYSNATLCCWEFTQINHICNSKQIKIIPSFAFIFLFIFKNFIKH